MNHNDCIKVDAQIMYNEILKVYELHFVEYMCHCLEFTQGLEITNCPWCGKKLKDD